MATSESNLPIVKLKTQSFGRATGSCTLRTYTNPANSVQYRYCSPSFEESYPGMKLQALSNYRAARENGNDIDSPSRIFPVPQESDFDHNGDLETGYYSYSINYPINAYWAQYNEGGEIKRWMQEKDLRYLARIGGAKTKFELAQRYHKGDKKADIEKNIIKKDIVEAIAWYEKAAELNNVEAYLALGKIYAEGDVKVTKDMIKAIDWYKKAADLKCVEAYLALGRIYLDADGVPKDEHQAIRWFCKAAVLNNEEALKWFQEPAKLDNSDALTELGAFAKTEEELQCLATNGDAKDKLNLAQRYYKGDAVITKDIIKAIDWYEKAAVLGSLEAYLALGDIYVDGDEQVTKDRFKAISWYERAAALGSLEACLALGGIYADNDEKATKDMIKAIGWYEKAAALGSIEAYLSLGDIYADGDEQVTQDVSKAIGWYEKAADLKSVEAYLALGDIYADGDEKFTKDMRKAIGWYKKAADLKSTEAYLALGQIYANGDGDDDIPIDEKVAIDYFRKAAELGDEEALSELKSLADTRNRDALCALECTAARHGPNKYKAQKYIQNSAGRHFFDPQRCVPQGEDGCVASSSIALILGTTLGLIGLMVLIWWWYKTPRPSELDISEMSEEDIQKAIENKDFVILNALLSDEDIKKDMKAWSFIGLDCEKLHFDDEKLLQCGIIFNKETLLKTTRDYLDEYKRNPDVNPLYLRRLFWGINRLLRTQRLSSKEVLSWQGILNRLENILDDELSVDLETDGIPLLSFHRSHHDNSSRETKDNSEKSNSFLLTQSAFFSSFSPSKFAISMSTKDKEEDIQQTSRSLSAEKIIKNSFLCPITQEIMFDPVIAIDGYTYERESILEALGRSMLSPMTGEPMESRTLISNHNTRSMIREFLTQHPEYWRQVYVSPTAINELLALSSGAVALDLQKWEAILRADSRLLTLPLNGVTLLEFLCKQKELMVTTYLPTFLNLLKPTDWQALIQVHSAEEWQVLVTQAYERCSAPDLKAQFLNKLQSALEDPITPLENSFENEKRVYKRA